MIDKVLFKDESMTLDYKMSIVRYPGSLGESGAYIFAPAVKDVPLKLKALDIFLVKGDI